MVNVNLEFKSQKVKYKNILQEFVVWLMRYRDFKNEVTLVIHDQPIVSYGDWNDCQVDLRTRTIYYSLYDITSYEVEKTIYNRKVSAKNNACVEMIENLTLQISKFYIMDKEDVDFKFYFDHYEDFEQKMYQEQFIMSNQFLTFSKYFNQPCQSGVFMKFKNEQPEKLIHAFHMFKDYLMEHYEFPLKLNVEITNEKLPGNDFGYFSVERNVFRYPKVNISTSSYQRLLKKMGDFDAELNILRIFAHEVGHYFEYISQYKSYQNEDCEKIANDYEEDMIQDFIDEVYYIYYPEEN
ncbi:hypothetical protein [Staphylococcus auricularis]|uniref:hypothetical protein n=1 Tax=Staphylococcus auricularis TaxID=29379 RepID=UPI00242A9FFE|nr:hypothetical protein [Staphylococcus auricularis]